MLTATDRIGIFHTTAVMLIALMILCSCGNKDDGVNRSRDGVLLPPGETFDDD